MTTMPKAELLEKMRTGWNELLAFIATLTPEQMSTPTDAAGWTMKDHLMHLAVWQEGVYALLEGRDRAAAMGVPQDVWDRFEFDEINAVIQQKHRDKTVAEVLQHLHAVKDKFHAKVEGLTEEELARPNPASPAGTQMIQYVQGDSYAHYAEHIPWMRAIAFGNSG
jgi:hypothetical protein